MTIYMQIPNLVQCDPTVGLTAELAERAVRILRGER